MSAPSLEQVLTLIEAGRRDAVVDLAADVAAAAGLAPVVSLLSDVQREVGRRWHLALWSVADEHAATAIVDLALGVASRQVPVPSPVGTMVVACAEEEWHGLPARILAEELRVLGWDVTYIGASVPAEHLTAHLARRRPDCALVSCSAPAHLPGARRTIAAAHAAGIRAMAGGAAFGGDPVRATVLGADGWAATAEGADRIGRTWLQRAHRLAGVPADRRQLALAARRHDALEAAVAGLSHDGRLEDQWLRSSVDVHQELDHVLRVVEATVLTGDQRIIVEHVRWLVPYLEPRGVSREAVGIALAAVRLALEEHPPARPLLDLAVEAVTGAGG